MELMLYGMSLVKLWKGLKTRRMSRVRCTPSFSLDGWGSAGRGKLCA